MNFSFDAQLIAKARELILHRLDLDHLLSCGEEARYPVLVQAIQKELKARDAAGKLLLPDLSALANRTIGIFSDYSGDTRASYYTYTFLICSWGSLDVFKREMKRVRKEFSLGDKEIEFKDFGMGEIQRALPSYLETLNGYVPGLLFTLVVDKRLKSLFGSSHKSTPEALAQMLEERGFGKRRPHVAEKVMRVVHTAAFLTALLGHERQQIFWMSDHDAVCPNPEMHDRMLWLYHNILTLYTAKTFGRIGGGRPFDKRSTEFLDLLSAADIAAGAVGQYFTGRDAVGEENVCVKPGAEKVLQWFGVDALALKKMCVMIAAGDNGAILSGPVEFTPRKLPESAIFLPTQLCR
jgi:hypothetical protein